MDVLYWFMYNVAPVVVIVICGAMAIIAAGGVLMPGYSALQRISGVSGVLVFSALAVAMWAMRWGGLLGQ